MNVFLQLKNIKILCVMILFVTCILIFKGYVYVSAIPKLFPFNLNITSIDGGKEHVSPCKKKEMYSFDMECRPCTRYELKAENTACAEFGNIEKIKCSPSGSTYLVSCPVAYKYENKKFWIFEGSILVLAVFSNIAVHWRRHILDSHFYQRIKKQISNSNV